MSRSTCADRSASHFLSFAFAPLLVGARMNYWPAYIEYSIETHGAVRRLGSVCEQLYFESLYGIRPLTITYAYGLPAHTGLTSTQAAHLWTHWEAHCSWGTHLRPGLIYKSCFYIQMTHSVTHLHDTKFKIWSKQLVPVLSRLQSTLPILTISPLGSHDAATLVW